MSAERLREMLSEATSGPWTVALKWGTAADETRVVARGNSWVADCQSHRAPVRNRANARLAALAPDAIALLADTEEALIPARDLLADEAKWDGGYAAVVEVIDAVLARLDALCGDEREALP